MLWHFLLVRSQAAGQTEPYGSNQGVPELALVFPGFFGKHWGYQKETWEPEGAEEPEEHSWLKGLYGNQREVVCHLSKLNGVK